MEILNKNKVQMFFTKEPKFLADYYEARKQVYIGGGKKFIGTLGKGKMDEFDNPNHPASHIMVVYNNYKCIGGVRLVVIEPGQKLLLPSETNNFIISKRAPEYELNRKRYCEISRIALLPGNGHILPDLYYEIRKKVFELKIEYGFSTSTKSRAIIFKRVASRTKSKVIIRDDINVPDDNMYDNIKMVLAVYDFRYECNNGVQRENQKNVLQTEAV